MNKMIVVKSRGYVTTSRGIVFAPISRPYKETPEKILRMISVERADVWEILSTGDEVKLTTSNYDKNNNAKHLGGVLAAAHAGTLIDTRGLEVPNNNDETDTTPNSHNDSTKKEYDNKWSKHNKHKQKKHERNDIPITNEKLDNEPEDNESANVTPEADIVTEVE